MTWESVICVMGMRRQSVSPDDMDLGFILLGNFTHTCCFLRPHGSPNEKYTIILFAVSANRVMRKWMREIIFSQDSR